MRLVLTVSVKVTAVLVTSPGFIGGGGEIDTTSQKFGVRQLENVRNPGPATWMTNQ